MPEPTKATPAAGPDLNIETLRRLRHEAAWRRRRLILNNDGNDASVTYAPPRGARETLLEQRTAALLVDSHVDSIFYCTGIFNLYTHRSAEIEPLDSLEGTDGSLVTALRAEDADPLSVMLDAARTSGRELFWSMRMNDTHDAFESHLWSRWKREHPEYLLGKREDVMSEDGQIDWSRVKRNVPYGSGRWSTLNYELAPVRDKALRILRDVCERYDIDGIELDFFRHPVYFGPQLAGGTVTEEQRDILTGFIRQCRTMTEEIGMRRGRPLLIAVRVPDSMGYARAVGLDVPRWLTEHAVDIVVGGGFFRLEPWESLARLGREYDVPVYACLSNFMRVDDVPDEWRGDALNAWDAGVQGIYTFNLFDPHSPLFRELGEPDILKERSCRYRHDPRASMAKQGQGADAWLKNGYDYLRTASWSPPPRYPNLVRAASVLLT